MDCSEGKGQKRPRSALSPDGAADSVEGADREKEEDHLGDQDTSEDDYDEDFNCPVMRMIRTPGVEYAYDDSIDQAAKGIDESKHWGPSLYTDLPDGEWSVTGTLLQLISVKIIGGAGKYLCGKIMSEDFKSVVYLYNRDSSNPEILGDEVATLMGPHRALQVDCNPNFLIDLSIKDSEYSEWKGVSRGVVTWDGFRITGGVFKHVVPGFYGSAKVTYSIIKNGVEAVVQVKMIGRSDNDLRVKVFASEEKFKHPKITLFDGLLHDIVDVEETIPLWRTVFAVSMDVGQKLKIEAILGDDGTDYVRSFDPKMRSYDEHYENTKYGRLAIKVAWSSMPPDKWPHEACMVTDSVPTS